MSKRSIPDGLYEEIITTNLHETLSTIEASDIYREAIEDEDAPSILAAYIAKALKQGLLIMNDNGSGVEDQTRLANKIITLINENIHDADGFSIVEPAEQLKTVLTNPLAKAINQKAKELPRPETPISSSSLFTGATREPNMAGELAKEIMSCDRIDMIVSFIRWSGVNLIWDELRRFTDSGKKLRIITTSYMGATELKAIEALSKLPNTEIHVSYDTERTRLHAKSYIFYRETGFSTAYVGSSNLTSPAMTSGCEWNIKVTKVDLPDVFDKVVASFEAYWHSPDFEVYTDADYDTLKAALEYQKKKGTPGEIKRLFYFDPYPYPYQQAILDRLQAEREIHNSYRNLIVAATGTGKTIISAFDYKRQCEKAHRRLTLLFVAHRREILEQSIECFREVMKDSQFADLFVGRYVPSQFDYLFISVEMLNSRNFTDAADSRKYEYIILDECHHSTAKSYQTVIEHFTPRFLLGLTATPERMDGNSILPIFNNRIAAEIRLPEAINRKLLCPFQYYGIADSVDLRDVKWTRGGYEKSELENLFVTSNETARKRARMIINSMQRYVVDLDAMKGLVFCVSIEHAKFMSGVFNEAGIPSAYLEANSSDRERIATREALENGTVKLVCVVDLYNEGVDIKTINTVFFLRPTDSLTVFLQQLGRGLRLADGKDCLTVLDFIGQANRKYRFEDKYNALLQTVGQGLRREIEDSFPHLPRGCYIKLEKIAKEYILDNIRNSVSTASGLIESLSTFEEDTGTRLTLANFLTYYNLKPRMVYGQKVTFSEYRSIADDGCATDREMWKKLYRVSTIDSIELLNYALSDFDAITGRIPADVPAEKIVYWKMLYSCFISGAPTNTERLIAGMREYWANNTAFIDEFRELLEYNQQHIDFIGENATLPYPCALKVYCTYTRAQALAAFDFWRTSSEGVTRIGALKTTCLFITLNKSSSYYSPSTAYHDYSINERLFHWQSQNATSDTTEVGQRYINHDTQGESILLFVREAKQDKHGSIPFTFLGKGEYVEHSGNKPMNIIWRLEHPIPANFIEITDKLGVV